jgi:hypothetical protein
MRTIQIITGVFPETLFPLLVNLNLRFKVNKKLSVFCTEYQINISGGATEIRMISEWLHNGGVFYDEIE